MFMVTPSFRLPIVPTTVSFTTQMWSPTRSAPVSSADLDRKKMNIPLHEKVLKMKDGFLQLSRNPWQRVCFVAERRLGPFAVSRQRD